MGSTDLSAILTADPSPSTLVNREDETAVLTTIGEDLGWQHLYLYGPYGSGKTLLTQLALETSPPAVETCYISCRRHDTQYKVLNQLYTLLTGDGMETGYHTAQLHDHIDRHLTQGPKRTIIVLDDLDFLLETDGNDLLYFLSRLKNTVKLHLISISANHPTLSHVLDERTYSRLRPHRLPFASYTADQAFEILDKRSQKALSGIDIDPEALTAITTWTTNIRLGLLWVVKAAKTVDNILTVDTVNAVRHAAAAHYRSLLLRDFTSHHFLLLDVITQLTDDGTTAATGTVYEQYTALCRTIGLPPLTLRRISDFLTHLELLHLIDVDHHDGGEHGKTRDIRLTPLQQL